MPTEKIKASRKAFSECISELENIAENYLSSQAKLKNHVLKFFKRISEKEKIANTLLNLINKITSSIDFPDFTFYSRIRFLSECKYIYNDINELCNKNKNDKSFHALSLKFNTILQKIVYELLSGDFASKESINLNYLSYYLDSISVGLNCPKNEAILKDEFLKCLSDYVADYPNSQVVRLVQAVSHSIRFDYVGVNKHTDRPQEKMNNILEFINSFRLELIERNESDLLFKINKIISRAQISTYPQSLDSTQNPAVVGKCGIKM